MSRSSRIVSLLALSLAACLPLSGRPSLAQVLPPAAPASTPAKPSDPLDRITPYGTIFGFLHAADAGNYSLAAMYLQLNPARRQTEGDALAMKLDVVMNRAFAGNLLPSHEPEGTPQEDVPLDRQRVGKLVAGDVEADLELVRITDPSSGKIWLISSNTLVKLQELYDQVQARQVEKGLPAWTVKHEFAGMPLWQWLALLLLFPVAAGVSWLLLVILQIPLRIWAKERGHVELTQWRTVSTPAWLFGGAIVHRILASYLNLPLLPRHYYNQLVAVAVIVGFFWILWRITRWSLQRVRSRALARGHSGTGSLMLLGERIIKALVVLTALFLIMGVLGFNMSTALAGVGIGTLAVGFGAQKTIENLFGGVSVLGDEVMRVGDVCKFGDRTGTVEDIGLRSTRVRTEERTLLVIPNGTVATINVENLSRRDKILFKTMLALHTDTSPNHVDYVLEEIRGVLSRHKKVETDSVRVRLVELTTSSINLELVAYILTRDFNEFAEAREELLLQIMTFVESSGTTLASPSQTLYLKGESSLKEGKPEAAKKSGDNVSPISPDRARLESKLRPQPPEAEKRGS